MHYNIDEDKNILPPRCCNLHKASRQIQDKIQRTTERQGRRLWLGTLKKTVPLGPTCKRVVLLGEDQSSSQKSWVHLKENWMSLQNSFSHRFPMSTEKKIEQLLLRSALGDHCCDWCQAQDAAKGKQYKLQSWLWKDRQRLKEQEHSWTRPGSLLFWKHPVSPQSICWYEDSLYPLQGLVWRDEGEKGLVHNHQAGNKRKLVCFVLWTIETFFRYSDNNYRKINPSF